MFVWDGLHQLLYISSNVIVGGGIDGELYLNFIEGKLYSLQTSVVNFANTGKSAMYNNLRSRNWLLSKHWKISSGCTNIIEGIFSPSQAGSFR